MLNDRGGFYRHENMISQYVMRVKVKMMRSLLRRLKQVPMLSGLEDIELYELAKVVAVMDVPCPFQCVLVSPSKVLVTVPGMWWCAMQPRALLHTPPSSSL